MRTNPFESQLERLARTLTERFGVTVVCQGDQACTDGRKILLPSMPEPMEESLERMVIGFLDHEMSHVAFSDFGVVKEFSTKHPGHEGLLNVVEDALIEKKAMDRWPGVRANLDAMFRELRGRVAAVLRQAEPFRRFCTAIYLKLSHHSDMMGLQPELAGYEDLLAEYSAVRDTRDAAELASKLSERWLKRNSPSANSHPEDGESNDQPRDDDESSGGQGDDQSNDDQAPPSDQEPGGNDAPSEDSSEDDHSDRDGSPTCASSNDEQPSQDSGSDGDDSQDDGDDASDSRAGEPDSNEPPTDQQPESDGRPGTPDAADARPDDEPPGGVASDGQGGSVIGEVLAEAIAVSAACDNGPRQYRVYTKQYDQIDLVPNANNRDVAQLLANGADTVRRLRRGLANALRSSEKRWWREDQGRGALSPRTLHRLCIDQPRLDVFRTRSMVQGRSTAVCIVLDASGSMTTPKMVVARDSMRVLLEALNDLKIPTEAFTFTTGCAFSLHDAANLVGEEPTEIRERFSRFGNLEIGLIKRFEEPIKAAMRRLPSIRGTGLTPLGEAMQIGAGHLVVRHESRKIMLVLTDGRAGCESPGWAASKHAQHVADLIGQSGIELIGVGIKDTNLRQIVTDTIVVHELQDLPAQLCKLLGRTLKKGLRHVG